MTKRVSVLGTFQRAGEGARPVSVGKQGKSLPSSQIQRNFIPGRFERLPPLPESISLREKRKYDVTGGKRRENRPRPFTGWGLYYFQDLLQETERKKDMYKQVATNLNFVEREKAVEAFWKENDIFRKSIDSRKEGPTYTFYDGPPTANGKPHIGHVQTRAIKDMIPRYRTMKGYMVPRKAGWDTHGLPVELEVEKASGTGWERAD